MTLTALQERVLAVVAGVDEAASFALAGGGALIVWGVVDRSTRDLDLFSPNQNAVEAAAAALVTGLEGAGLGVTRRREAPGFVALAVTDDAGAGTMVELARDHRWLDPVTTDVGRVLDLRELAADKMCALFGRAAPRDVLDVAALIGRFALGDMVGWATRKDTGFDLGVTVDMVAAARLAAVAPAAEVAAFTATRDRLADDLRALTRTREQRSNGGEGRRR